MAPRSAKQAAASGIRFRFMQPTVALYGKNPLKYLADIPLSVKYTGRGHGLIFLLYVATIVTTGVERKWSIWKMFLFFLAALMPFGPFAAEAKFLKETE